MLVILFVFDCVCVYIFYVHFSKHIPIDAKVKCATLCFAFESIDKVYIHKCVCAMCVCRCKTHIALALVNSSIYSAAMLFQFFLFFLFFGFSRADRCVIVFACFFIVCMFSLDY